MSFSRERYKTIKRLEDLWSGKTSFDSLCSEVFQYQKATNSIYRSYLEYIGKDKISPELPEQIPCLPIEFFKNNVIKSGDWQMQDVFLSSGTGSSGLSKHYIRDIKAYEQNAIASFEFFYGPPGEFCFLALLPHYLERKGSSLIRMMERFIKESAYSESGFYLDNYPSLVKRLDHCLQKNIPTLLFGVSFALIEFSELHPCDLSHIMVMETGGMKTQNKEMAKSEIYRILMERLQIKEVHSEYGMTELYSQAYSNSQGLFFTPPSMRVFTTQLNDPYSLEKHEKTGQINIIDLANIDTCSFIATSDLGKIHNNGSFEVLGRMQDTDIRGCNLMLSEF